MAFWNRTKEQDMTPPPQLTPDEQALALYEEHVGVPERPAPFHAVAELPAPNTELDTRDAVRAGQEGVLGGFATLGMIAGQFNTTEARLGFAQRFGTSVEAALPTVEATQAAQTTTVAGIYERFEDEGKQLVGRQQTLLGSCHALATQSDTLGRFIQIYAVGTADSILTINGVRGTLLELDAKKKRLMTEVLKLTQAEADARDKHRALDGATRVAAHDEEASGAALIPAWDTLLTAQDKLKTLVADQASAEAHTLKKYSTVYIDEARKLNGWECTIGDENDLIVEIARQEVKDQSKVVEDAEIALKAREAKATQSSRIARLAEESLAAAVTARELAQQALAEGNDDLVVHEKRYNDEFDKAQSLVRAGETHRELIEPLLEKCQASLDAWLDAAIKECLQIRADLAQRAKHVEYLQKSPYWLDPNLVGKLPKGVLPEYIVAQVEASEELQPAVLAVLQHKLLLVWQENHGGQPHPEQQLALTQNADVFSLNYVWTPPVQEEQPGQASA